MPCLRACIHHVIQPRDPLPVARWCYRCVLCFYVTPRCLVSADETCVISVVRLVVYDDLRVHAVDLSLRFGPATHRRSSFILTGRKVRSIKMQIHSGVLLSVTPYTCLLILFILDTSVNRHYWWLKCKSFSVRSSVLSLRSVTSSLETLWDTWRESWNSFLRLGFKVVVSSLSQQD